MSGEKFLKHLNYVHLAPDKHEIAVSNVLVQLPYGNLRQVDLYQVSQTS